MRETREKGRTRNHPTAELSNFRTFEDELSRTNFRAAVQSQARSLVPSAERARLRAPARRPASR